MSNQPDAKKAKQSETQLAQLKAHTIVVADTGDIESIKQYKPTDATTNPSLILASATNAQYKHLVENAVSFAKENTAKYPIDNYFDDKTNGTTVTESASDAVLNLAMDKVCVNFGAEILKIVDGVVSTEVDARLSFDKDLSVARARRIIKLYEEVGVAKERILIKLASTWEGFLAAKVLKEEGIKCNMTLLFNFCQAVVAAEVGVELISPFVGRILDWNKKNASSPEELAKFEVAVTDPGVVSVRNIYNYYKKHGYETIVMGASFRSKGEILELTGCDKLTIGPKFLKQLEESEDSVGVKLTMETALKDAAVPEKISLDEKAFRWELNQDAMATEKLAEGIRNFAKDIVKLENIVKGMI